MLFTAAKWLAYALGVLLLMALVTIGPLLYLAAPTSDEVVSVVSPNGRVTATLVETNGGATTAFGYVVRLAPSHAPQQAQPVASLYDARRSWQSYGAKLRWQSSSELVVEYLSAASADLRTDSFAVGGETVHIVLRSGVNDELAPAGGMLFNLKRQANKP